MADLSGKTSDKTTTRWAKYALGDDAWKHRTWRLTAPFNGNPAGTEFTITSPTTARIGLVTVAATSLGPIPLSKIEAPHPRANAGVTEALYGLLYEHRAEFPLVAPALSELAEREVLKVVNTAFTVASRHIRHGVDVSISGYTVDRCVGLAKVPGTVRADFALIGFDGNNRLCEKFWISHKAEDGRGARSFQQYASLTDRAGESISRHPEVQVFLRDVYDAAMTGRGLGARIIKRVVNEDLMWRVLYGPDAALGSESTGPNAVDLFAQGDAVVRQQGNGDLKIRFETQHAAEGTGWARDDYAPFLGVRPDMGRSVTIPGTDLVIPRVRAFIAPRAAFGPSAVDISAVLG